jgi:hypothetical protein
MIQLKEGARVENPREYELSAVEQLRRLLENGSQGQPDPQRTHFYEIDTQNETYYIYISPISGNVALLAKWLRQSEECCMSPEELVA